MSDRLVNVTLTANTAPFVAGMNSATAATQRATASTATMSAGMKQTGASMANVGAQAGLLRGGLVNPITAAGVATIGAAKAAIDWESAWAGVTKTVDGTDAQLSTLHDDLRDMATQLPASANEIAGVAEAAGQLGVKVEDVADFSRTMVDLGETTNLASDQAATSIARLTNIMGTGQDEVERLGSTLVELGNNSATTEAEILELGTRLAAAGQIAGLSESDVLAFAATLTSVGVNAEAGGTALSKVFTSVRDAVIDGGRQLETFARVAGVSADQFATAFRTDPALAIASFIDGLGDMSRAGESTTGVFEDLELTDQRLMRALLSTAEAGDLLTDSIELGNDAWDQNLALAEEAAKRYDTVSANLSRNFNRIKDEAIDAGGPVADFFDAFVEGTADLVEIGTADLMAGGFGGELPGVIGSLNEEEERLKLARERANQQKRFNSEIQGLLNRLPEATGEAEEFADAQAGVAEQTSTATASLQRYNDMTIAATDPVFELFNRLTQVKEAQEALDETLADSESTQADVEQAAWDLAAAEAGVQQAAVNADLSIDAFDAQLARWVEQGRITEGQADILRGSYEDLTGAAEGYEGDYDATVDVKGEAKARSEIQGLLNRAAAWAGTHTAHFNATVSSNTVSGSIGNLLAGRAHKGGLVTQSRILAAHHHNEEAPA